MLTTLLESRHARRRHPLLVALSVAVHAGAILAVAATSGRGDPAPSRSLAPDERPLYQQLPDRRQTPTARATRCTSCVAPAAPTLPRVSDVPLGIPDPGATPAIDFDAIIADAGRGAGTPAGSDDGSAPHGSDSGILDAAVVERPAIAAPGNVPPRYPESLRAAGVEGTVLVELVIDTAGRVEAGSVRIVDASRPAFAAAVRAVLAGYRFLPAEVADRPVRVRVRLPFTFELR